jgi:hypothetical protein
MSYDDAANLGPVGDNVSAIVPVVRMQVKMEKIDHRGTNMNKENPREGDYWMNVANRNDRFGTDDPTVMVG